MKRYVKRAIAQFQDDGFEPSFTSLPSIQPPFYRATKCFRQGTEVGVETHADAFSELHMSTLYLTPVGRRHSNTSMQVGDVYIQLHVMIGHRGRCAVRGGSGRVADADAEGT